MAGVVSVLDEGWVMAEVVSHCYHPPGHLQVS